MKFINPIEILQHSTLAETSQLDNEIIKKAKRRIFAEIDLSDNGLFDYYGTQISKSDCERAIDELTSEKAKKYYTYLVRNTKLNEYLINGNEKFFFNLREDDIFKESEFIQFISPYYAPKFEKTFYHSFITNNTILLKLIIKKTNLLTPEDQNSAYRGVSNLLKNRLAEITKIKTDIINEISIYTNSNIYKITDIIKSHFPFETINCLPEYFNSQILKIANEINSLIVAIWDNFDNTQVNVDLLEHILKLNIDGLNKPIFEKNYELVKRKNQEKIEESRNAPILKRYANFLILSKNRITAIENKTTSPNLVLIWVNASLSIQELNELPKTFDEIKNQVALSLRAMSMSVWNNYSDLKIATQLIEKALNIQGLRIINRVKLLEDQKQLKTFQEQKLKVVFESEPSDSDELRPIAKSNTKNKDYLWTVAIIISFGIVLAFFNSNNKNSNNYENYESETPNTIDTIGNEYYDNSTTSNSSVNNEYIEPVESEYKGNQLWDGASPLDGCFGKGIYGGNATLTIDNGGSSDAIVCLYSIYQGRTIRNEYVRKNSSFTMSNIAQGSYKIRVFYGNDWNPNMTNTCGTKGNFESDVHFSEFDGTEYFEDSYRGYTTATITLYAIEGGNAPSTAIDQSTFFNN